MDKELLRKIVTRIQPMTRDITVSGYSKEDVEDVITELLKQGVIMAVTGTEYIPEFENSTIKEGSVLSVEKTGKVVNGYQMMESKLKKIYGINQLGKDID